MLSIIINLDRVLLLLLLLLYRGVVFGVTYGGYINYYHMEVFLFTAGWGSERRSLREMCGQKLTLFGKGGGSQMGGRGGS